jgi:PST family polysaccharide transporter
MIVNLSVVAGIVLFPSFASIERSALRSAYETAIRYVLMVSLPMTIGLCLLAEPLVLTAFGDQWLDSIPVMRILTAFAFFEAIGIPGGIVYKSIGRVEVLIKLIMPQAVLAIGGILIFVDNGIEAVATCQAVAAAVGSLLSTTVAARLLKTGWRGMWDAAAPSLAAGAVLAMTVVAVDALISDPVLTLVAAIPIGAVAYVGSLWLLAPDVLSKLWQTALNRRPQPAEAGSGTG